MTVRPGTRPIARSLAVALAAAAVLSGCARKPEPAPTTQTVVYVTRAEVRAVPVPGDPRAEFVAHHETIPDFKSSLKEGAKIGMNAMVMPFPLAPGLDLTGIQPGDKVRITFEVIYALDTGTLQDARTTRVEELPPDTVLDLTAPAEPTPDAEPPASADANPPAPAPGQ